MNEALDLGFDCFGEGEHNPFFILAGRRGKRQLVDLHDVTGTIDSNLVAAGRDIIKNLTPGRFYALVWDGYLSTDEGKHDAIFVEAGEKGERRAHIFAQCYTKRKRPRGLIKIGRPLVVRKVKPLWK